MLLLATFLVTFHIPNLNAPNQEEGVEQGSSDVQLRWHGTCIHDFKTPRWVQKQRQVDSDQNDAVRIYDEPKRATAVAVNNKFSLIAIGTHG